MLNPCCLALLLLLSCAGCSNEKQIPGKEKTIRYCHPDSGLLAESELTSLAGISKDLFLGDTLVLMDDLFADLKPWKVVGEKNNEFPYFNLITLPKGKTALKAQSGACNKGRMMSLSNMKPLIACLRIQRTSNTSLEKSVSTKHHPIIKEANTAW